MHLVFAVFWFIVAVVVLILPHVYPAVGKLTFRGTDISLAWFALALSGYFTLRWWTTRASRQAPLQGLQRRRRQREEAPETPIREFMFDKPSEWDYDPPPNAKPGTNGSADKKP